MVISFIGEVTVMTAKSNKNSHLTKQSFIGAAVGIAVSLGASLVTAWIALKTQNPLSVADTMAAVCVLLGAGTAAVCGCVGTKSFMGGLCSGGVYTLLCVVVSLCMSDTAGSPLVLIGAAVLGVFGGCALVRGHKPNTKKRLKKYVKR